MANGPLRIFYLQHTDQSVAYISALNTRTQDPLLFAHVVLAFCNRAATVIELSPDTL